MRILIIEDEKNLAETLKEQLQEHYVIETAFTGRDGLQSALSHPYDLITIDITLPDLNGIEICKKLRLSHIQTPILMLTGTVDVAEKVQALDAGADDYLTKPFSFTELQARIRALLRRMPDARSLSVLMIDDLKLNPEERTVQREGKTIQLRKKEFDLLEYLMRNHRRVLSRDMIIEHVWDGHADPFTNAVDVHIKHLRDVVDRPFHKKLIKTVHGIGYKIDDKE